MNDTELRRAYDALLSRRAREEHAAAVPLERIAALVEGRGAEAERLATLDLVLRDATAAREFALLRAVAAARPRVARRAPARTVLLGLAVAASVTLLVLPRLRTTASPDVAEPMRDAAQAPRLVAPATEAGAADSRRFVWRTVRGTRSYAFELLTAEGGPVFTTRTSDTTLVLPGDVRLARDVEHRWWVASVATDGTRSRSPFRRLVVRDAP